jgi:eukaryotic-like serine/threonine-protein kinase
MVRHHDEDAKSIEATARTPAAERTSIVEDTVADGAPLLNGRYLLLELIGSGSMGRVHRARDLLLHDRPVAVKIACERARGADDFARFQREQRAIAKLNHPNILVLYDAGETDEGLPFFVTELLEGTPLDRLLEENPRLELRRVLEILAEVCSALDAAHREQIIHRDIKPQNIFCVQNNGLETVKVLDFGVAKIFDRNTDSITTSAGAIIGTPAYFSPEQAAGRATSPKSDLYSVGVLAYRMLTGVLPFDREEPGLLIADHLHAAPRPISAFSPPIPVPPRVERLVMSCLAKSPEERPTSAAIMRDQLLDIIRELEALRISAKPLRAYLAAAIALVFLAAAGIFYFERSRGQTTQPPEGYLDIPLDRGAEKK